MPAVRNGAPVPQGAVLTDPRGVLTYGISLRSVGGFSEASKLTTADTVALNHFFPRTCLRTVPAHETHGFC
jgi:hypothetical protein